MTAVEVPIRCIEYTASDELLETASESQPASSSLQLTRIPSESIFVEKSIFVENCDRVEDQQSGLKNRVDTESHSDRSGVLEEKIESIPPVPETQCHACLRRAVVLDSATPGKVRELFHSSSS